MRPALIAATPFARIASAHVVCPLVVIGTFGRPPMSPQGGASRRRHTIGKIVRLLERCSRVVLRGRQSTGTRSWALRYRLRQPDRTCRRCRPGLHLGSLRCVCNTCARHGHRRWRQHLRRGGQSAARMGVRTDGAGAIIEGCQAVFSNGNPAARLDLPLPPTDEN
jgi:hypothetical protein